MVFSGHIEHTNSVEGGIEMALLEDISDTARFEKFKLAVSTAHAHT